MYLYYNTKVFQIRQSWCEQYQDRELKRFIKLRVLLRTKYIDVITKCKLLSDSLICPNLPILVDMLVGRTERCNISPGYSVLYDIEKISLFCLSYLAWTPCLALTYEKQWCHQSYLPATG